MKMKNMSKKEAKNPEHYLGYVMSILSDEINHLKFGRYVASLEARDVVEIDEETFIGHATCIMGLADLIDKKFSSRNDILS